MTPERFLLISKIHRAAVELDAATREDFLDQQCGGDTDLRKHVESLLAGGKSAEAELLSLAMKESVRRLSDEMARPLVGQVLDHYEVLSHIGSGGMGEVYRARDINLGRDVALKLLPSGVSSGTDRRRFEREARAASALNHPNILTIHEIEQANDHRFMVAEFIEGETVREKLGKGPIPLNEALEIAIQAASALAAAHAAGIVHRDIKPENIMMRRDGLVKVLDFGLAKVSEAKHVSGKADQSTVEWFHTDAGVVVGTASYMSPEQTRGLDIDSRTDIWSLGVVLYEMLTGTLPFTGETRSDVIVSILQREPPKLNNEFGNNQGALNAIFEQTLNKDRNQRYQTAGELLHDLKNLKQYSETQSHQKRLTKSGLAHPSPTNRLLKFVLLSALVAVAAFVLYKLYQQRARETVRSASKVTPFTTFTGREQQPTFSPDGNQIAFSWNGEKGDNFDIYVKLVNSEASALRLTNNPADDIYPAWSPDGQQIAFVRHVGAGIDIYTISALGGTERKIYSGTSSFYALYEFGNALSWSPDGKYLAFSGQPSPGQPNGIFLLSIETLETRQLTTPPEGFLGDSTPAFSPDGKLLAFVRGASSRDVEVYVMPSTGGEPKRLTFDNRSGRSLAWSADSKSIVFSSWFYGGLKLFKVLAAGGTPEQLDVGTEFASTLAISRQGTRLAYSQEFRDTNIWRIDLNNGSKKHTRLISSTRQDYSPQYSADGKKIAFTTGRTGSNEVWVSDAEGMNAGPITSFGGPDVGSPRWSPNGEQIAFDSLAPGHRDIYVVGAQGGKPRRLNGDNFDNVRPSWSHDGQWIYFGSNRTGDWQLWKAPASGGQPVQLTKQGGREGFESTDGNFVYYTKGFGLAGLWKVPTAGGEEIFVVGGVLQGFWGLLDKGVYFVNPDTAPNAAIEFFNFTTSRETKVAEIEKDLQLVYPSLAISPDGQSLLYVQSDSFESDIMLVEDFH